MLFVDRDSKKKDTIGELLRGQVVYIPGRISETNAIASYFGAKAPLGSFYLTTLSLD